jgi:hypothetical protein
MDKALLPKSTQRTRLIEAALATVIMIVVSLKPTYQATNAVTNFLAGLVGAKGKDFIITPNNVTTYPGLLLHAVVFFLLLWATLELVERYASE